jgi:sugar phosphate isomerase/epimerase
MLFNHELYNTGDTVSDNNYFDGSIYPPYPISDDKSPEDYSIFLPLAIRVAAKTIGLDLVAVQPMEQPYDYDEEIRKRKREQRKKKIEELFPEMKKHEK